MSKFFVGQRVRFITDTVLLRDSVAGMEGIVVAIAPTTSDKGKLYPMVVELIGDRRKVCASPDLIVPLTPPKQQETVTWDAAPFTRDGKWKEVVHA
jgi:hypothetical protein